jgi:hypothetical protein
MTWNGANFDTARRTRATRRGCFVLAPTPSWTFNFHQGQEHPDVIYLATEPAGQNRRDQSTQPYVLSSSLGVFDSIQPTWFGQQDGPW